MRESDINIDKKVLSIAKDLVYVVSNSRKLKHFGAGMNLHQATSSKDLINFIMLLGTALARSKCAE